MTNLIKTNFKTPKAAAVAGILFCLLLIAALWLLRISTPNDPLEPGEWLRTSSNRIALELNLVPFSGLAFLWFIGVYGTGWAAAKTDSLPQCFLEAAFCLLRCCSRRPPS